MGYILTEDVRIEIKSMGITVDKDNLTDELAKKLLARNKAYSKYIVKEVRAHNTDGKFTPDDPSTEKNEAFTKPKKKTKKS